MAVLSTPQDLAKAQEQTALSMADKTTANTRAASLTPGSTTNVIENTPAQFKAEPGTYVNPQGIEMTYTAEDLKNPASGFLSADWTRKPEPAAATVTTTPTGETTTGTETTKTATESDQNKILSSLSSGMATAEEVAADSGLDLAFVTAQLKNNPTYANMAEKNSLTNQGDTAYKKYQKDMDDIMAGTFELTADEKTQVENVKAMYDQMRAEQVLANANYEGAVLSSEARSGRQEFMNTLSQGIYKQAVERGLAKIRDLESRASNSLIALRDAFKNKRYKAAAAAYDATMKYIAERKSVITDIYNATKDLQKAQVDAEKEDYKRYQDSVVNSIKMATLDLNTAKAAFSQVMQSDKFDYQQKQDAIKNLLAKDKLTWDQKKAEMDKAQKESANNLASAKFEWEKAQADKNMDFKEKELKQAKYIAAQNHDIALSNYQLALEKASALDSKANRAEYEAIKGALGKTDMTYEDFLIRKGTVVTKPPTADQFNAAGYATRMQNAANTITLLTDNFAKKGFQWQIKDAWGPNVLKSTEYQVMEQAERNFLSGILRRESGAAITESELSEYAKQYFPQPGDSEAVLAAKAKNRMMSTENIANAAGTAVSDEFRSSVKSGKAFYPTLGVYLQINPEMYDASYKIKSDNLDKMKTDPNTKELSDDDILQILIGPQSNLSNVGGDTKEAAPVKVNLAPVKIGTKTVQVDKSIADKLAKAEAEFKKLTGKDLQINQSYRTKAEQEALYNKLSATGARVAKPGTSFHEKGLAIDVTNWKEAEPILRKYGFRNDLADDKGHFSIGEFA